MAKRRSMCQSIYVHSACHCMDRFKLRISLCSHTKCLNHSYLLVSVHSDTVWYIFLHVLHCAHRKTLFGNSAFNMLDEVLVSQPWLLAAEPIQTLRYDSASLCGRSGNSQHQCHAWSSKIQCISRTVQQGCNALRHCGARQVGFDCTVMRTWWELVSIEWRTCRACI